MRKIEQFETQVSRDDKLLRSNYLGQDVTVPDFTKYRPKVEYLQTSLGLGAKINPIHSTAKKVTEASPPKQFETYKEDTTSKKESLAMIKAA